MKLPAPARPADRASVVALIPAYLEERHIRDVAARTLKQVDRLVVVDDGSTDSTFDEACAGGAEVIRHPVNRGKGAAIKTGFRKLLEERVEYVLLLDGDGQHLPEEIPRFLKAGTAHVVVGNRMSDTRKMPLVRRLTNRLMSWQVSRICQQSIPDSQCGFRMIQRALIPQLFVRSNTYEYETEMLFIAARAGLAIRAVPVTTVYGDEKSKICPVRDSIHFFRLIARYWIGSSPMILPRI
jgi:glycosyltransferase involved in cell wall biosynthesis